MFADGAHAVAAAISTAKSYAAGLQANDIDRGHPRGSQDGVTERIKAAHADVRVAREQWPKP